MIESLRLHDFQRHSDIKVDLDPLVTVVTGPSDSGKSSVIRALRWLATNLPHGDSFVRDGSDCAWVGVKVDGKRIVRKKGKGVNTYVVDGNQYEAFGFDVPQQVQDIVGIGRNNLGLQFDAPFWFGLTPGEVAKELNAVVDLDAIDDVLGSLAAEARAAKAAAGVCGERLAGAEAELTRLMGVPVLEAAFGRLEGLGTDALARRSQEALFCEAVARGIKLGREARNARAGHALASTAVLTGKAALGLAERECRLSGLLEEQARWGVKVAAGSPDTSGLDAAKARYDDAYNSAERLRTMLARAKSCSDSLAGAVKGRLEADDVLRRESGGVCPLCGSTMETRA